MKKAPTLILLFLCCSLGLFAQQWRIGGEVGVTGLPQKDRAPGLHAELQLERQLPLFGTTSLLVSSGLTHQRYTNTENYRVLEQFNVELPLCDCNFFPNERLVFIRSEAFVGIGLEQSIGRISLRAGARASLGLRNQLKEKIYSNEASPSLELLGVNKRPINELTSGYNDRSFQEAALSRKVNTTAFLGINYGLTDRINLSVHLRQTVGNLILNEQSYWQRNTLPPTIVQNGRWYRADATVRSFSVGLNYVL